MRYKCETGDPRFDDNIRARKAEYLAKVGEPYVSRTCDEYMLL